jgi:hypothetical protein
MENENNCRITYIYGLYEVGKEDEIRYIGKTYNPKERLRSHTKNFKSNKDKSVWIKNIISNGSRIGMVILEECYENWSDSEKNWINKYGLSNLTNISSGGQNGKYYDISYDDFKKWVEYNLPNIKTLREWLLCVKNGLVPDNIPKYPYRVYPQMKSFGDVLRTGKIHNIELTKNYLTYDDAKKYIKHLNIESIQDWIVKYNELDSSLFPKKPDRYYKKRGWINWGDFLGNGNVRGCDKVFISYDECKKYANFNNINSQKEWFNHVKINKPIGVPSSPQSSYKENWISWMCFFDRVEKNIRYEYLSYNDAKELVKENKLNRYSDFKKFIKGKSKEYRIPSHPESHYIEWSGWNDFFN